MSFKSSFLVGQSAWVLLVSPEEEVSIFQKSFEAFKMRIAYASRSCGGFTLKILMWA